jgi:hypothetical protein
MAADVVFAANPNAKMRDDILIWKRDGMAGPGLRVPLQTFS